MEFEEAFKMVDAAIFAKEGRHLSDAEVTILRGTWEGIKYDQMAQTSQYSVNYLMRDVGPKFWKSLSEALGEQVSKANFRAVLERRNGIVGAGFPRPEQGSRGTEEQTRQNLKFKSQNSSSHPQSWGDAPDVSVFYGRTAELTTLEQWTVQERCRLVALLGMEGIGKTALSVRLAQQIRDEFEYISWRSLRQAPSVHQFVLSFLSHLPSQVSPPLPEDIDGLVSQLIHVFRTSRCLLILDNVETILQSGELAGHYRDGYQGYGHLLRRVGQESHNSCVILTSLEKPREIAQLAGKTLPVRTWTLKDLEEADAREILKAKGLSGEAQWSKLIKLYRGNPLALKLVATTINELFNGDVAAFLKRETLVFGDIHDLLAQPFNRLSELEKEILYWLAIEQQPCPLSILETDILLPIRERDLLEALASLGRRSLIETPIESGETLFSLQPAVMEYVRNQFIEQVSEEICDLLKTQKIENTQLFRSHALVKNDIQEVRENVSLPANSLFTVVVDQLRTMMRSETKIIQPLQEMLPMLQKKSPLEIGYAQDNTLNLLQAFTFTPEQDTLQKRETRFLEVET